MTIKKNPYNEALKRMEHLIAGLPDPAPFYKAFAEAIDRAREVGSGNQSASAEPAATTHRSEAP